MEGVTLDNTQFGNFKTKLHIFPNHLFVILFFIQRLENIKWVFPEHICATLLVSHPYKTFRFSIEQGSLQCPEG